MLLLTKVSWLAGLCANFQTTVLMYVDRGALMLLLQGQINCFDACKYCTVSWRPVEDLYISKWVGHTGQHYAYGNTSRNHSKSEDYASYMKKRRYGQVRPRRRLLSSLPTLPRKRIYGQIRHTAHKRYSVLYVEAMATYATELLPQSLLHVETQISVPVFCTQSFSYWIHIYIYGLYETA